MNIKEAYSILEVDDSISDIELKNKYKELAKKYHPDIFKDDPDKFKIINEAYQFVTNYRANPAKYEQNIGGGFWNNVVDLGDILFNGSDFFKNIQNQSHLPSHNIELPLKITFHEAVMGCNKEIKYTRNLKCSLCNGIGAKHIGNGCDKCDGFGRVTINNGNMIFQSSCAKCRGRGVKKEKCEKCGNKRIVSEERNGAINIPSASKNGDVLRLAGEGNYYGRQMLSDNYTDVFVHISVEPYKEMWMKDNDVYSNCNLSLLEALEGTTKEIETVYGNKQLTIPVKTRHKDEIIITGLGAKNKGNHRIILNVEYPDDINPIVGVLKDAIHNQL